MHMAAVALVPRSNASSVHHNFSIVLVADNGTLAKLPEDLWMCTLADNEQESCPMGSVASVYGMDEEDKEGKDLAAILPSDHAMESSEALKNYAFANEDGEHPNLVDLFEAQEDDADEARRHLLWGRRRRR
jgi:hypothetical protein